jgi:Family of unknown function (DUF6356)
MDIGSWFKSHPAAVGETYGEHLFMASSFGCRMVLAGVACMLHGVFPFLFVRTGSRTVAELNQRMIAGRSTRPVPGALHTDLLNT